MAMGSLPTICQLDGSKFLLLTRSWQGSCNLALLPTKSLAACPRTSMDVRLRGFPIRAASYSSRMSSYGVIDLVSRKADYRLFNTFNELSEPPVIGLFCVETKRVA
jgi:hypothetical protein